MSKRAITCGCGLSFDLILSLSKDKVVTPGRVKSSTLRQAQGEDFGEAPMRQVHLRVPFA
jgi:hypothetical protein